MQPAMYKANESKSKTDCLALSSFPFVCVMIVLIIIRQSYHIIKPTAIKQASKQTKKQAKKPSSLQTSKQAKPKPNPKSSSKMVNVPYEARIILTLIASAMTFGVAMSSHHLAHGRDVGIMQKRQFPWERVEEDTRKNLIFNEQYERLLQESRAKRQ